MEQLSYSPGEIIFRARRALDAVLLLLRMEGFFSQCITWCEVADVFACLAAPLLLSHCIYSRESTSKLCKRHTPLGFPQDYSNTSLLHEEKKKRNSSEGT